MSECFHVSTFQNLPREIVGGYGISKEIRLSRNSAVLGWEKLKTIDGVDVVEG